MKHAFCLHFAYSLTMEYGLARKAFIITLILHMPWNQHDVIGCIFIFRKHLSGMKVMKNLCDLKRIIWKLPVPMASVSRRAWAPSLHVNSPEQSLTKPLPLCKIAYVSTVYAGAPHTVIMHQVSISKWTRVFHYQVHFHLCTVKNM